MRERKKRKSPYHWVAMVMVFTVAITSLFVLVLYLDSPDVFLIKKVDSETGEVSCSFNYEKAYDLFIQGIGAWGAVLVGVIALSQSESSHRLAEKLASRENSCNVYISNYTSSNPMEKTFTLSNDNSPKYVESDEYIYLTFCNHGNAFLKSVDIFFGNAVFGSYLTLANGMEKKYRIYLPKDFNNSHTVTCDIVFTSCNNEKTFGDFEIRAGSSKQKNIMYYHFYGTENHNGIKV